MPELELRPAKPAQFDAIAGLLSAAGLPVEDLNVTMLDAFVVATEGEVCVGVVGLEIHESNALLRSLAVEPQHRSRGLGARLVGAIETEAQARGVTALYLLTTTATTFFERAGERPGIGDGSREAQGPGDRNGRTRRRATDQRRTPDRRGDQCAGFRDGRDRHGSLPSPTR